MNELFLRFVNLSISASWIVLAVLILRIVLKRAPKWVNVLLWGIVAARLIFPFSIESALSLVPSAETIPMNIELDVAPAIDSGVNAIDSAINPVISTSFAPQPSDSVNPLQVRIQIASLLWIAGIVAMLLYTAVSYWRLRRMVNTAVLYRDNIFQSENVSSPFVLGIIKPKIYLPFNMKGQDLEYVVAHEEAHICRRDHWWKPLGFLLLMLHWFNPLMWLAYVLLCRDIELACDEKIIKGLDNEQRADYTQALVSCSVRHRRIAACPLAFGEVGVKERVKSVMNYRKPAFWIILIAIIACIVVAVCFLTNPENDRDFPLLNYENLVSLAADSDTLPVHIGSDSNKYDTIVNGDKLAAFLDKASWTAQRGIFRTVQRDAEKSTTSIQIKFASDLYLRIFDTDTAVIYAQGRTVYYRTQAGDYDTVLAVCSNNQETVNGDRDSVVREIIDRIQRVISDPHSSPEEVNFPDCVSFSLPEGLTAGEFDIYLGIGGGIPIYNDKGEECGCFEFHCRNKGIFEDGELIGMSLFHNHSAFVSDFIPIESGTPCVAVEYLREVRDEETSQYIGEEKLWYAFWAKEGHMPQYALYLCADAFEFEELVSIAKSVTFTDEAFVVASEEEAIQNPMINDGTPGGS